MSDLGDLPSAAARALLRDAADLAADYLEHIEEQRVFPDVRPGMVAASLPRSAPQDPQPLGDILRDVREIIIPNLTHWNHPGFLAYIAITGSVPGVAAELLSAAFNVNAMLWRTSPAATELEERACDWVRELVGLPESFRGHINDTASIGVMLALAAARERRLPDVRERGLFGAGPLAIYTSDQAHSSVDKAAIALGFGLAAVRRLPCSPEFRLDPEALSRAIRSDLASGITPLAVVATAGTTSTGSLDPIDPVADLAREHDLWLHVDAAYGGGAAICPEIRAKMPGLQRADSIVINPHKWLFVPVDCSLLYLQRPELLQAAFSLVPPYLAAPERVNNLMSYGPQLGRRFRALKLWMVLRAFGADGIRARIREHCRLASLFASWIDADPRLERLHDPELAIVAFRAKGDDALQQHILDAVNRSGEIFLSHSVLRGQMVLRVVVGNIRTTERHLSRAWSLIRGALPA